MDMVDDKIVWYESIIDAIPFPIHVTDNNMKWTYLNKPFSDLMIANGVIKNREQAFGMDCCNAVVGEEVRSLAARSADAVKETTGLIEGSINKVQTGTRIADETASALNEIVDGIGKVSNLVGNIAEASNEQATGIAQIN